MNPIYVKGHLSFTHDKKNLEFIHQNISVYGVAGLPWEPLNPIAHFGQSVQTTIRIPGDSTLTLECPARIAREYTLFHQSMGLVFTLTDDQKAQLSEVIRKSGFFPTEHIRKYPRIPSASVIRTFPLRALVTPIKRNAAGDLLPAPQPMVFDVENLSPNGVLLSTENQNSSELMPGDRIKIVLQPRGWFPTPIHADGVLCRIIDDIDPRNGNQVRRVGLKLSHIDESNRQSFLDLMKDILEALKSTGASG